jgi:hypothetical protein
MQKLVRKCGWVTLLALAACGDDSGKKQTSRDAGQHPDGGQGDQCDRTQIGDYSGNSDPRVWTEADYSACQKACPNPDQACLDANCTDWEKFYGCVDDELFACETAQGGDCRLEYENAACCQYALCEQFTEDALTACVQQSCAFEFDAVNTCYQQGYDGTSPGNCLTKSYDSCLLPGGACDGGTCDGGASCDSGSVAARPGYKGSVTYTKADLKACNNACADEPKASLPTCHAESCPGYDEYAKCVSAQTSACLTAPQGDCRASWEALSCCTESACGAVAETDLASCIANSCATEQSAYNQCAAAKSSGTCQDTAKADCLVQPADAGVEDAGAQDAGSDAGVDGSASNPKQRRIPGTRVGGAHVSVSNVQKVQRAFGAGGR